MIKFMGIGDRVRERREALGLTQPQLAKAVKDQGGSLSQGQISTLETGAVARPRALPELALALRTTVQWLLTGQDSASLMPQRQEDVTIHRGRIVAAADPLVIYRSLPSGLKSGETLIYKERAGLTSRPEELAFSSSAFAYRVVDDDAEPRYERRATLIVDPEITPAEGDDCLFVRDPKSNPLVGIVRRLVRVTPDQWIVRRFSKESPPQKLDRSEWGGALHIFGSYNRR